MLQFVAVEATPPNQHRLTHWLSGVGSTATNYSNIISGSQTKVEKTKFFIVFSTLDGDHEIIM